MEGWVSSTSIPCLTEDLIIEVLLNLPVKSLVRFSCVCKFFQYLITSSHFFIRAQIQISLNKYESNPGGPKNVFFSYAFRHDHDTHYTENLDAQRKRILEKITGALADSHSCRLISERNIRHCQQLAGCCDGIMCFYSICYDCTISDTNLVIYLCNPALNQCRVIPRSNNQNRRVRYCKFNTKVCFMSDPVSSDYQVITVAASQRGTFFMVEIYSLKNNSWRTFTWDIPNPGDLAGYSDVVVHNGFLYWISVHLGDHILNELDKTHEKIRQILLPDCLRTTRHIYLLRFKGYLAISECQSWPQSNEVWVMNEDNVGISWAKILLHLNPACIGSPLSYFCRCFHDSYFCILPWATTNWTCFKVYEGNIYWGGVENGPKAEEFIRGREDDLNTFSDYIAVEYAASLVSVFPSLQPVHGNFMQRQILDGGKKRKTRSSLMAKRRTKPLKVKKRQA